jgi:magnesium-transporting ATPase (P-type)
MYRRLAGMPRPLLFSPHLLLTILSPQRVRTLTEFRTMSVVPYPIRCYRDSEWREIQTDKLLPGDIVSISQSSTAQLPPL